MGRTPICSLPVLLSEQLDLQVCLLCLSSVFVFCICLLYLPIVLYLSFVFVCCLLCWSVINYLFTGAPPEPPVTTSPGHGHSLTERSLYKNKSFLVVVRYKCFRTFLSYISILQRSLLSFEMFKKIYFYLTKWSLYLTFFIFLKHQLRMK